MTTQQQHRRIQGIAIDSFRLEPSAVRETRALFAGPPHPRIERPLFIDTAEAPAPLEQRPDDGAAAVAHYDAGAPDVQYDPGVAAVHLGTHLSEAVAVMHIRDVAHALLHAERHGGFGSAPRSLGGHARGGRMALLFGHLDDVGAPATRDRDVVAFARGLLRASRAVSSKSSQSSPDFERPPVSGANSVAGLARTADLFFRAPEVRAHANVDAFLARMPALCAADLQRALAQPELLAFDDVVSALAKAHGAKLARSLDERAAFDIAGLLPIEDALIAVLADVEQPQLTRGLAAELLGRRRAFSAVDVLRRALLEPLPLLFERAAHALIRMSSQDEAGVVVGDAAVTLCPHPFASLMTSSPSSPSPPSTPHAGALPAPERRHCADCDAVVTHVRDLPRVDLPPWHGDDIEVRLHGPHVRADLKVQRLAPGARLRAFHLDTHSVDGVWATVLHPALTRELRLQNIGGALAILGDPVRPHAVVDEKNPELAVGPLRFTRARTGAIDVDGGADLGRGPPQIIVG